MQVTLRSLIWSKVLITLVGIKPSTLGGSGCLLLDEDRKCSDSLPMAQHVLSWISGFPVWLFFVLILIISLLKHHGYKNVHRWISVIEYTPPMFSIVLRFDYWFYLSISFSWLALVLPLPSLILPMPECWLVSAYHRRNVWAGPRACIQSDCCPQRENLDIQSHSRMLAHSGKSTWGQAGKQPSASQGRPFKQKQTCQPRPAQDCEEEDSSPPMPGIDYHYSSK